MTYTLPADTAAPYPLVVPLTSIAEIATMSHIVHHALSILRGPDDADVVVLPAVPFDGDGSCETNNPDTRVALARWSDAELAAELRQRGVIPFPKSRTSAE